MLKKIHGEIQHKPVRQQLLMIKMSQKPTFQMAGEEN